MYLGGGVLTVVVLENQIEGISNNVYQLLKEVQLVG